MKRFIVELVVFFSVAVCFGAGVTPISNLKLVDSANGNQVSFTNLQSVSVGSGTNVVSISSNSISIGGSEITKAKMDSWDAGGSAAPSSITGTSYSLLSTDTNYLVLVHSNRETAIDMSGVYVWGTNTYPSGAYMLGVDKSVSLDGTQWRVYDEAGGIYIYTNATILGVYYPYTVQSKGTITASYLVETNVFAGAGNRVNATHLGGLPASSYVTNDGGVTNLVYTNAVVGASRIAGKDLVLGTNTPVGSGTFTMPTSITGDTYSVIYKDTNTLIVSSGGTPEMSGVYTWNGAGWSGDTGGGGFGDILSPPYMSGFALEVQPGVNVWTNNSLITPEGTYYPNWSASGNIDVRFALLTNVFVRSGVDGLHINATYLGGLPASSYMTNRIISSGLVGEDVTTGAVVYVSSDGRYKKAWATNTATPAVAIMLQSAMSNTVGSMLRYGEYRDSSMSFTKGARVWVETNPVGRVTTTKPTGAGIELQCVGVATDTNAFYFNPSTTTITLQ